jgi:hypothetical protein
MHALLTASQSKIKVKLRRFRLYDVSDCVFTPLFRCQLTSRLFSSMVTACSRKTTGGRGRRRGLLESLLGLRPTKDFKEVTSSVALQSEREQCQACINL